MSTKNDAREWEMQSWMENISISCINNQRHTKPLSINKWQVIATK